MHNPILVIGLAGLASWLFGAAWYMTLGKAWQRALGLNPDDCKDKKMPLAPLAICLVAEWVMAAVVYQTLTNLGVGGWLDGAIAGLTLGVGFLFTTTLVNNAFQGRKLALTAIDGVHWVLVVTIQAAIVAGLTG